MGRCGEEGLDVVLWASCRDDLRSAELLERRMSCYFINIYARIRWEVSSVSMFLARLMLGLDVGLESADLETAAPRCRQIHIETHWIR